MYHWLRSVAEALAPQRCAGCDRPAPGILCERCVEHLLGLPLPHPQGQPYGCRHAALPYDRVVRRAVHRAKYRGCAAAMHVLGALAAERLAVSLGGLPSPDAVVAVPLGRRRRRHRGFNQAEVAARPLLEVADGATLISGLVRARETASQVGRSGADRRTNPRGAFVWQGEPLAGARLWLVDDVITTGATLEAAAAALQQGGAGRIEAVAVCVADPRSLRE